MKRVYIFLFFVLAGLQCMAQLKAPIQTDTLVITSVKYNYMDIKRENWPCDVIYKSTTCFEIADQKFEIESARQLSSHRGETHIDYVIKDGSGLSFFENNTQVRVVFSGYEFICKRTEIPKVSANSPNVQVKGRTIVGTIPKPNYNTQAEGTVVVIVYVDQYGNVTHAKPGAEGSTTSNADLLSAARSAAMKTHFNQSAKAPALQEGTITYVFKLR